MTTETFLFINCFALMGLLVIQSVINHRAIRTSRKLLKYVDALVGHVHELADLGARNNEIALQLAREQYELRATAGFWFTEWLKAASR